MVDVDHHCPKIVLKSISQAVVTNLTADPDVFLRLPLVSQLFGKIRSLTSHFVRPHPLSKALGGLLSQRGLVGARSGLVRSFVRCET